MRLLPALFPVLALGCSYHEVKECDDFGYGADTGGLSEGPGDEGPNDEDPTDEDPADEDPAELSFSFEPGSALPGDVFIGSLTADQPLDWSGVEEVVLYGDAKLCASQARSDELLLTVGIPADAPPGVVDLVIIMADGETYFLPDALTIEAYEEEGEEEQGEEQAPPDGSSICGS